MIPEVTYEEVKQAYIKMKSNIYFDRGDLYRRKQLAVFESDLAPNKIFTNGAYNYDRDFWGSFKKVGLDEKFEIIADALNNYDSKGKKFFDHFLKEVEIQYLPKKIRKADKENFPSNFITNQRVSEKYTVERATAFIDIPTELEIVVVLWILRHGWILDKELGSSCYGNRLILNKDKSDVIKGSGLFKPYFTQYQTWRDDCFSKAEQILKNNKNAVFLNVDFRDYFYSVNIELSKLDRKVMGARYKADDPIHELFKIIHVDFTKKLIEKDFPFKKRVFDDKNPVVLLPIGLLSSYVLGNWYLKEFDTQVLQKIRPAFYGRYVDDILIVFEDPDFEFNSSLECKKIAFDFKNYKIENPNDEILFDYKDLNLVEQFIIETFYPIIKIKTLPRYLTHSLDSNQKREEVKIFELNCISGIYFQSDKTLVYFFDANESIAALDKLKQDIQERASEFRDFPEDEDVEIDFDSQAYELVFDGSQSKVRTLKDYKENRYGLSVFLANRIFAALRRDNPEHVVEGEKIIKFFKGLNVIEYFKLWEKIFTYFVVNNNHKGFVRFYKNVLTELLKLFSSVKIKGVKVEYTEVCSALIQHLNISFEMAISLNPKFFDKEIESLKSLEYFQNAKGQEIDFITKFQELTKNDSFYRPRIRHSNIIRHDYVIHPLYNYAFAEKTRSYNLVDKSIKSLEKPIEISDRQKDLSPRSVRFYECCLFEVYKCLLNTKSVGVVTDTYCYPELWLKNYEHYLDDAYQLFTKINERQESTNVLDQEEYKDKIYKLIRYPKGLSNEEQQEAFEVSEVWVNKSIETNFKIGFANTEVKVANIEASINKKPIKSKERFSILSRTLKEARLNKVDLLLFPEFYLPYEQVSSLAKFSVKNQIAVVVGLEHWNVCDSAFNFIVTILPFEVNGIKDALVHYRLKNHYAHIEESIVRGYGFKVPKPAPYHYNIFNWKGLYFSPFYCFELADISHRSFFRSKLDLLIASEWNKDVNYFSNIVESLTRDIHSYVAQVNTSNFGDSRLTQPKESALKDILKLKGGINDALLVGEINVKTLRNFQLKGFDLGKQDKSGFKPTPPDFDRSYVKKRINNEFLL